MGVYGSPQLGPFAENNNYNKRPPSRSPWKMIIIIMAIACVIIFLKSNVYVMEKIASLDFFKTENAVSVTQNTSKSPLFTPSEKPVNPKETPGILDNQTGIYFKRDREVRDNIVSIIEFIMIETNMGNLNQIETKTKINNAKELLEDISGLPVNTNYQIYKDQSNQTYQATIELLENYISTKNMNYDTAASLLNDFSKLSNSLYELTKELFDKYEIHYDETIGEDGSKQISYRYSGTF